MSSVSSTSENGALAKAFESISSTADANEKAGAKIGNQVSDLEGDLMKAYSLNKDSAGLKALAKKYGLGANASPEAVQQVLNLKLNKAMRAFNAFENLMKAMHELIMSVIRNIGR